MHARTRLEPHFRYEIVDQLLVAMGLGLRLGLGALCWFRRSCLLPVASPFFQAGAENRICFDLHLVLSALDNLSLSAWSVFLFYLFLADWDRYR